MCKMKGIACRDEPKVEVSSHSEAPLNSIRGVSVLQLIVLVFQHTALEFWFTLPTPIDLISSSF